MRIKDVAMTVHELRLLVVLASVLAFVIIAVAMVVKALRKTDAPNARVGSIVVGVFFFLAAADCGADKVARRLTDWFVASVIRMSSDDAGAGDVAQGVSADVSVDAVADRRQDFEVSGLAVGRAFLTADVKRPVEDSGTAETFDILYSHSLLGEWRLFDGAGGFAAGETNCHVVISCTDLVECSTNMPPEFFVEFGRHVDNDDDGIYDARESRLYGTAPCVWDTDGDGVDDGSEIAAGTDPRNPDSDEDGYSDGEEMIVRTDPSSWNPGAAMTIRYSYDDDDRLLSAYAGECESVTAVEFSGAGNGIRLSCGVKRP